MYKQSPNTPPHPTRIVIDKKKSNGTLSRPHQPVKQSKRARGKSEDATEEKENAIEMLDWDVIDAVYGVTEDTSTGEASLRNLANNFRKQNPLFNHRIFGFTTFRKFCEALAPKYLLVESTGNGSLALCKPINRCLKKSRSSV